MKAKEPTIVTQARLIRDLRDRQNRSGHMNMWKVWYTPMPEGKIVEFLEQFPWVKKYIAVLGISQVYSSGIDPLMATWRMHDDSFDDSFFGGVTIREYAYLLDENGELVRRDYEKTETFNKWLFFGPLISKKIKCQATGAVPARGTIAMATRELRYEAEKVRFILSFDNWTKVAIVYRRPEGLSFQEWIEGKGNKFDQVEV